MRAEDLFEQITDQLITDIETGAAGTWRMPWHTLADAGTPTSVDGRPYRGMNAVWLAMVAAGRGWDSGLWATYRGWQRHGAQVRRGERATQVILWKPTAPTTPSEGHHDDDTPQRRRLQLQSQANTIRERVERINSSLQAIDYHAGRYIRLVPETTPNTEIRQFQDDLRACTSNITAGAIDDQYSEQRFLQVKALVDRFRGREGTTDQDRAWTRRVTDVRQWYVFSASERWRETDEEHESYSDSSGKSGGQKEKLAYTILAASLAYQFKLDRDDEGRTFRFVVIDEAFGRGSDDSTRYALRLFSELGLQLLIVTPLQKIHVIEPYVACVGLVQNPEGNRSLLQRITIEEHRATRASAATASRRSAPN
jgi:hypothetical protein